MKKARLTLSVTLVSLVVAGLVISYFWTEWGTKQPAAADVIVSGSSADPSSNPTISQQGERGIGFDPLYPGEQAQARALVLSDTRVAQRTQDVRHAVLQVQRRQESKDRRPGVRRADVLVYVYAEDILLHGIANLESNVVDDVIVTQKVQPLISPDEALHALNIALADAAVGPLIRQYHEDRTGAPLVGPEQLRMTAGVYTAGNMPNRTAARECGVHRCAQLRINPNLVPIVDLSTEQVVYAGQ